MQAQKELDRANNKRYALVRTPSKEKDVDDKDGGGGGGGGDKKKKKKKNRDG